MKIWIDADACPRDIQEVVVRACSRLQIAVRRVANRTLRPHASPLVQDVRVGERFDAADAHIVAGVEPGDLVITADIPLAAEVIAAGAHALGPRGERFTEDNIGGLLATRDLMADLRSAGLAGGGPPPIGRADVQRFANTLDRLLTALRGR